MTVTCRTRVWRGGTLDKSDVALADLPGLLAEEDSLTWLDLLDPKPADVHELATALKLDWHTVEDALTVGERPKVTRYSDYSFITCFTAAGTAEQDDVHRMSLIVLPRAVITVRLGGNFPVDTVDAAIENNSDLPRMGAKALLHAILDTVVDGYFDVLTAIDDEVDVLESRLFDGGRRAGPAVAREAFTLHKKVGRMRRVTLPMREVVTAMLRRVGTDSPGHGLLPFYEDLYDHAMRVAEWSESLRDTLESVQDTNLALGDAALNQIMKKLTAWAAIIAVPTAITGWYGQNVPYPGFGQMWGFWTSTALILAIAGILYVVFRRKDWF
jgi:magnesium transporter